MSKFTRFKNTASRLIKENGIAYQVRRTVHIAPDPVQGTPGTETTETQSLYAVVLPINNSNLTISGENGIFKLNERHNSLISVEGLEWGLEPDNEILIDGVWRKLGPELVALKPNGVVLIMYKALIRTV